jgi:hypothetical protein
LLSFELLIKLQRGAFVSEPAILVKRRNKGSQVWSMEKFENKIIDMRDLYEECKEKGLVEQVDDDSSNAPIVFKEGVRQQAWFCSFIFLSSILIFFFGFGEHIILLCFPTISFFFHIAWMPFKI